MDQPKTAPLRIPTFGRKGEKLVRPMRPVRVRTLSTQLCRSLEADFFKLNDNIARSGAIPATYALYTQLKKILTGLTGLSSCAR